MKLLRNAKTFLSHPEIAKDYLNYSLSKIKNSGQAIRAFPGNIKVTGFSGFSEFHSCSNCVSKAERNFFQAYSLSSGDLIDVGANMGIVSMILAERFPERKIYAFEPSPSTFQTLKKNLLFNKYIHVQPQQLAIANHDGEVTFDADPINRATASIKNSPGSNIVTVPCVSLDSFCQNHSIQEIAFLKVDVEGYEEFVFQGAAKLLSKQQIKVIYYEVCPNNAIKAGLKPEYATQILIDNGYQIYELNEKGSLKEISLSDINKVILSNWIAIPK